ncbi:NAD-dependent epimerase/dehydratase family protein [Chryseolinea sp. T2]|uniref:NAD-dependent epimerase/dehydratase family protein n=1 Tax=Chryseolinea sp. T2 TaxID=3129255 RepID=UPI0030779928
MAFKILITGGAGFVGSSLALKLKAAYPEYIVFVLDNLKRRGSELNLPRLKEAGVSFVHGDIRNKGDFDALDKDFTHIIEASAEPSVLAGLNGSPDYLIDTNLNGTVNCLSFARICNAAFLFLSTSRVYPIRKLEDCSFEEKETRFNFTAKQTVAGVSEKGISEMFPLDGYRSLYGTTKLASELIIQEFNEFYGLKTIINRCGVLTGPWQMGKVDQGVIVLWMARHFWKQKLSYLGYGGEGKQVRDVLHVNDLFDILDIQLHTFDKYNNQIFNIGGGIETSLSLQELTEYCQQITGNTIPIEKVKENRQADLRIYVTDNTKISALSGWTPKTSCLEILTDVYEWLKGNEHSLKEILK